MKENLKSVKKKKDHKIQKENWKKMEKVQKKRSHDTKKKWKKIEKVFIWKAQQLLAIWYK